MGAGFACASHVVGKKNLSDTELAAKAAKMSYSISVVGHMNHPSIVFILENGTRRFTLKSKDLYALFPHYSYTIQGHQ